MFTLQKQSWKQLDIDAHGFALQLASRFKLMLGLESRKTRFQGFDDIAFDMDALAYSSRMSVPQTGG